MERFSLEYLLTIIPAIIIGFTFHEFFHAYTALKLGDDSPAIHKRLTLNPMVHIDIFGFLLLIAVGFGWAKPVIIDTSKFKKPVRDEILVALAGPLTNFVLAFIFLGIWRITGLFFEKGMGDITTFDTITRFFINIAYINVVLGVFNSIPIPPLDGSHIITSLLSKRFRRIVIPYIRYGSFVLIGILILQSFLNITILPIAWICQQIINFFVNILW